jgi:hypothetical protein
MPLFGHCQDAASIAYLSVELKERLKMTAKPDWTSPLQWIKFLLMLAGIFIGLPLAAIVPFVPVNYQAFDSSCRVQGFVPGLQAKIQGKRFWVKQLELLDEELLRPSPEEALKQSQKEIAQMMEDLYQRTPDLRPSPQQIEVDRLRKESAALLTRADAIEYPEMAANTQRVRLEMELERQRKQKVLRSCRSTIEARAQPE